MSSYNYNNPVSTPDPRTGSAGPHRSNMANKLDPLVDSDLDHRAQYAPGTTTTGNSHPGATAHLGSTFSNTGTTNPNSAGPHHSNLMNQMDPRVDSDVDNRARYGPSTTTPGNQYTATSGTAGPQNSSLVNKLDPGVDSDRDNRAQYAPSTATTTNKSSSSGGAKGPHSSSILNKLDPRVDSKTGEMTTKSTNAPTSSGGVGVSVGHNPTASSGSTTYPGHSNAAQTGENVGTRVKGAAAGVHGMGESLRGGLNAAVDKTFGHDQGVAKDDMIAQQGEREMRTGHFHGH